MTPEGGGVVVAVRREPTAWVVTRTVPDGTGVVGRARTMNGAVYLLIRAYRDGVSTRDLVAHVGNGEAKVALRGLVDGGGVGRTKGGLWVVGESRLSADMLP